MDRHDSHLKNHHKRQAPETIAKRVSNSRKNKKENASSKRKRIASTKNENISNDYQLFHQHSVLSLNNINNCTDTDTLQQPHSEIQQFPVLSIIINYFTY